MLEDPFSMLLSGATSPSASKVEDPFNATTTFTNLSRETTMAEQPKEPAEQSGSGAETAVGGWGDDDDSIDID